MSRRSCWPARVRDGIVPRLGSGGGTDGGVPARTVRARADGRTFRAAVRLDTLRRMTAQTAPEGC
ncbi:hypothetical protein ACQPXS_45500 [Streptomyces sp. CA-142005]|uniref:hypothetical protein n=1 Tax=Streptomyces sp. CA-142005 TaxID=3240052 RepID=UPI003D8BD5BE